MAGEVYTYLFLLPNLLLFHPTVAESGFHHLTLLTMKRTTKVGRGLLDFAYIIVGGGRVLCCGVLQGGGVSQQWQNWCSTLGE